MIHEHTKLYHEKMRNMFDAFPHEGFEKLVDAMITARDRGNRIFTMGNGGSGASASHWVADINKGCSYQMPSRFRMMCLNDNMATVLAYSNDVGYDHVFLEQLKNFVEPNDVVIGISGSGNSRNVLHAIDYAKEVGALTVGLVGFSGGKLAESADVVLHVAINDMQIVEDMHMLIAHMTMQRFTA